MEGGDEGLLKVLDSKDLQQQSQALDKFTDRVEDRQLNSIRVQEAMAALASSKEADWNAMRMRFASFVSMLLYNLGLFVSSDAMVKDTLERATGPNFDLKTYLQGAYIHPVFRKHGFDRPLAVNDEENNLVPTKRNSRMNTPGESKHGSDREDIEN